MKRRGAKPPVGSTNVKESSSIPTTATQPAAGKATTRSGRAPVANR
jgi:hypothetical protein